MKIDINKLLPNPEQPRKYFDPIEMSNLAQSIREHGVILPLAVEETKAGMFIIHDGERRWRAAKMAGLKEVEANVTEPLNGTGPQERLERALIANIQRADLSPIEEGKGYAKLKELGLSNNQIALSIGVNIARVYKMLKALELDEPIQDLINKGKLSPEVRLVKALLDVPDPKARILLASRLAEHHTTVNAGVEACKKLTGQLAAEKFGDGTPAITLAVEKEGEVRRPIWDALAQVGRLPPWILVELAARDTCKACSLRGLASNVVCKNCPAVEMLAQMIGKTK